MVYSNFLRILALGLVLSAAPAFAVNRTVRISAPAAAAPGAPVQVSISVATAATDGERIGFLHAEFSTDGGRTWHTRYAENLGKTATQLVDFTAGPAGSTTMVRVRVAFRGGLAGDVDFAGDPIRWEQSWSRWETPPARTAAIPIKPPKL